MMQTQPYPQLDLFALVEQKPEHIDIQIGQSFRDRREIRAASPEIKNEIISIFKSRPNEWLAYGDFVEVAIRHDIRSRLGHILAQISREELLMCRNRFFGSEHPRDGNYLGFQPEYLYEEVTT